MNLNLHFQNPSNYLDVRAGYRRFKRITCADGLSFSAQANEGAYCSPRDGVGPWVSVEIGFPSVVVEELMQYAENPEDPTGTVYGWVPVEVVESVIEKHGGLMGLEKRNLRQAEISKEIEFLKEKIRELEAEAKSL
jgi:hypothetical protein